MFFSLVFSPSVLLKIRTQGIADFPVIIAAIMVVVGLSTEPKITDTFGGVFRYHAVIFTRETGDTGKGSQPDVFQAPVIP